MSNELTTRLDSCERIIERGLGTFVEVGTALKAIRDERLYRSEHLTFEAYLEVRWGFTRQRAHQMIEAADIVEAVSTMVDIAPASERQARELVGLAPEVAAEVMESAAESGKVTAETIRKAREDVTGVAKVTQTTRTTEATKREFDADVLTGEIIDDRQQAEARLNAVMMGSPQEQAALTLQRNFDPIIRALNDINRFDPERCAELLDEYAPDLIEGCFKSWAQWMDKFRAARKPTLRIVKG